LSNKIESNIPTVASNKQNTTLRNWLSQLFEKLLENISSVVLFYPFLTKVTYYTKVRWLHIYVNHPQTPATYLQFYSTCNSVNCQVIKLLPCFDPNEWCTLQYWFELTTSLDDKNYTQATTLPGFYNVLCFVFLPRLSDSSRKSELFVGQQDRPSPDLQRGHQESEVGRSTALSTLHAGNGGSKQPEVWNKVWIESDLTYLNYLACLTYLT
jgi:hypothetical protein